MKTTLIAPQRIEAPHCPDDGNKVAQLADSMRRNGWAGAPVVVIDRKDADPMAITGSHRLAAAHEAGIDVPTVEFAALLAEHGADFADLLADFEHMGLDPDDAALEVALRAYMWLPAGALDRYGLDLH